MLLIDFPGDVDEGWYWENLNCLLSPFDNLINLN
jgi:hypothetical protein